MAWPAARETSDALPGPALGLAAAGKQHESTHPMSPGFVDEGGDGLGRARNREIRGIVEVDGRDAFEAVVPARLPGPIEDG